jgi:hypothetical protein
MKGVVFSLAALLLAAGASAQQAPPPEPAPAASAALIRSMDVQPGDSELVRAAKASLARRQKSRTVVIDNKAVKAAKGHLSEPTQPLPPIPQSVESNAIVTPPQRIGAPEVDRSSVEARIANLKKEEERLQAEALEAPYTEVDEGATAQKLAKIHDEITKLEKNLQPHQAKP